MEIYYRLKYTVYLGDFYGEEDVEVESDDRIFENENPIEAREEAIRLVIEIQQKYLIPWHTYFHFYLIHKGEEVLLARGWDLPKHGFYEKSLAMEKSLLKSMGLL